MCTAHSLSCFPTSLSTRRFPLIPLILDPIVAPCPRAITPVPISLAVSLTRVIVTPPSKSTCPTQRFVISFPLTDVGEIDLRRWGCIPDVGTIARTRRRHGRSGTFVVFGCLEVGIRDVRCEKG
jgi:hypothetical protein